MPAVKRKRTPKQKPPEPTIAERQAAKTLTELPKLVALLETDEGWAKFQERVPQHPHVIYPTVTRERILELLIQKNWTDAQVLELLHRREVMISREHAEPIYYGYEFPMWKKADAVWNRGRELLILGGNRCLGGETLIYDPVLRRQRMISEIDSDSHVLAWDGTRIVTASASKPFTKGVDDIYRIELDGGEWFTAAGEHRVLGANGQWLPVSMLRPGFSLFRPQSISGSGLSVHGLDDRHWNQTQLGSQSGCHSESRLCGEQPLEASDTCQWPFPLQGGVPTRKPVFDTSRLLRSTNAVHLRGYSMGDPDNGFLRIQADLWSDHRATPDGHWRIGGQFAGTGFHSSCIPCKLASPLCGDPIHYAGDLRSTAAFSRFQSSGECLQLDNQSSCDLAYVRSVTWVRIDNKWDISVPAHGNYLCAGVIHHNSSKTCYAAKRAIRVMMDKPESVVWCFSTSFETSVRDQQRIMFQHLPHIWKTAKRSRITNVSYTQKMGFSQKVFIAPNGSECRFMNYMQDSDVIEGGQVDLWWADELIPADWITTLRSRTVDRRGRGLITQTPIRGYTQTVAEYLNGATVTEWIDCPELPTQKHWPGGTTGKVPLVMQCMNPSNRVMFFHSKNNAFVPYDELWNAWKDKGSAAILCRLYGVTSGLSNCKFPRFGSHNILPHEKIPEKGTNYHVIDFSWNKPWAMLWARVVRQADKKFIYIYREWPDMDGYGEWVLRSEKPDGVAGPAQHSIGYGINDYKRLILSLESVRANPDGSAILSETEPVFTRYGDPRSGAAASLADEGATTIFQMLERSDEKNPEMIVEPVVGHDNNYEIMEGVNLVNTWLEYNPDAPMGPLNCPQLYISEKCQNLIECMKMWTGSERNGASKDFIDLLRYLAMMDPEDAKEMSFATNESGGSY